MSSRGGDGGSVTRAAACVDAGEDTLIDPYGAEAVEEALALMERRAEKAEAVFEARRATT